MRPRPRPRTRPQVGSSPLPCIVSECAAPESIGLIAGQGQLPLLVARGIRSAGRGVAAVGLAGQFDPSLPRECDTFREVGLASLGRWIRTFRRWQVREAVMVGRVSQKRKYATFQWLHHPPDWRAIWLWYRYLRHDRRTRMVLTALADELGRNGVTLIDSRTYIEDHLATAGVMTRHSPTAESQRDIDFGWPLLEQLLALGIGQSMAVRGRDVVAVEAAEGTDGMIERAGEVCGRRPWVLLKASAKDHDMRADVATIGVETITRLHAAGGRAIAVGVKRVILIDRPAVIGEADRLGVAIVGRE